MPELKQSKFVRFWLLIFGVMLTLCIAGNGYGQNKLNSRFILANQLMQQGEYQQAYQILSRLYEQFPQSYPVYDRTLECLIQLKRFDQAIDMTKKRMNNNDQDVITGVRLGELYQLKGDTARSNEVWQKVLKANKNNLHVYRYLAQTEQKYHNYDRASEIYDRARKQLKNPNLFLFESANNYVMAADYDKASKLYVKILQTDPGQIGAIQHQILRADDPQLYDSVILDLQDASQKYSFRDHEMQIQQLLIWLYTERELYHKALITAQKLEVSLNGKGFPVFNLGKRLVSLNKFELANQAFKWYADHPGSPLAGDALEQRAHLYISWAHYLEQYHLALENHIDSLYHTSYNLLEDLSRKYPAKASQADLLTFESELALDRIHSVKSAVNNLGPLEQSVKNDHDKAQLEYLRGRIQLFQGDYSHARVSFTRSNKLAKNSSLAAKTRYYLCLTDFYAGDFEFAKIQMHALEQEHTSMYANDALKLRMYIQNGMVLDSVTPPLNQFAHALYLYDTGKNDTAVDTLLSPVINYDRFELKGDMVLLIVKAWRDSHPELSYLLIDHFLQDNPTGAVAERLYWERARLAHTLYKEKKNIEQLNIGGFKKSHPDLSKSPQIIAYLTYNAESRLKTASTKDGVIKAYEDLLRHYPRAFYATYARNQIQQLQEEESRS